MTKNSTQRHIEQHLTLHFHPSHLQVINESHQHHVPPDSETHFKVVLVSALFQGKMRVARHRLVYDALADALKNGVHALALHLYTPEEWQKMAEQFPASPRCRGVGA